MKKILSIVLLLALVIGQTDLYAQYRKKVPLFGATNQIAVGAKAIVIDDSIASSKLLPNTLLPNDAYRNIGSLFVNDNGTKMLPDSFVLSLKVSFLSKRVGATVLDSIKNQLLEVSYFKNKPYKQRDLFQLFNVAESTLHIDSIKVLYSTAALVLPHITLQNELIVSRDYKFSCTNNAIKTITGNAATLTTNGEYTVSWPIETAADEYDLEWSYVEKSALDAGAYNISASNTAIDPNKVFKNKTRVTIKNTSYAIPMLYDDEGSLFFRVRAVQYLNDKLLYTSNWSSDYVNGMGRHNFVGHQPNLNWQSTTTYAEDGKRKTVVQYYDGTLRSRQTVTKDNTRDATVVAETYYDKQGRPAVQILPTPTLNSIIKFTPLINQVNAGTELTKDIYDTIINPSDFCSSGMPKMNNGTGAAKYYSANNSKAAIGFNQAIPDAEGYVFTETKYAQDNTGRVIEQSGVGKEYQIGGLHSTKTDYGGALQEELDAIFGTEVGYAEYYQKNLVKDANGQVSVSYVDMQGRTIATALAGDPPSNVDSLSNFAVDATYTKSLIKGNNNVINGTAIELTDAIVVDKAGPHQFKYALNPQVLTLANCKNNNICYDCMYDLNITITSNCYVPSWNGSSLTIKRSNVSLAQLDTLCTITNKPAILVDTTVSLEIGSFTVTKSLKINDAALQYYTDSVFLKNNLCKTYQQFFQTQLDSVRGKIDCNPTVTQDKDYLMYRKLMLSDVSPIGGQYANYPVAASNINKFSIFNNYPTPSTATPNRTANYQYPYTPYVDENGQVSKVYSISLDKEVAPEELTPEEFAANFKSSWAISLLPFHPEYCLLQEYEALAAAHEYSQDMQDITTYREARDKGYLNPLGYSTSTPISCTPTLNNTQYGQYQTKFGSGNKDPFYTLATSETCKMHSYLQNAGTFTNVVTINYWSLATLLAKCDTLPALPGQRPTFAQSCINQYGAFTSAFDTTNLCKGDLNAAWIIFRNVYTSKKNILIDNYIRNRCYNTVKENTIITRVFPDVEAFFSSNDINNATQNATTGMDNFFANNCKAQASRWLQELEPCKLGGQTSLSAADSAWIMVRLTEVCKQGSDVNHPLGASTVKPGSYYIYKSFDDVIKDFAQIHGRDYQNCNGYLITNPPAYEVSSPAVSKPILTKPNSCECTMLTNYKNNYDINKAGYSTFSSYLKGKYNANLSDADATTLLNACNPNSDCKYLTKVVQLPMTLQCNVGPVCASCDTITALYTRYKTIFPTKLPDSTAGTNYDVLPNNILFANYMNQHLGFSYKSSVYFDFMDSCARFYNPAPIVNTLVPCDTIIKYATKFRSIYQQKLDGGVYRDVKLTSAAYKIVDGANALVTAYQSDKATGTPVILPPYGLEAQSYDYLVSNVGNNKYLNKLNAISKRTNVGADTNSIYYGTYCITMPLDLNYTYLGLDLNKYKLNNAYALAGDFASTPPADELGKRVYAVSNTMYTTTFGLQWAGTSNIAIPYYYYRNNAPLIRYIANDSTGTGDGNFSNELNSIYGYTFFELPTNITTPAGYNQFYDSSLAKSIFINAKDIAAISKPTIDSRFYDFYNNISKSESSSRLLKVKITLKTGAVKDAYLVSNSDGQVFVKYKEVVDSNLYQDNCEAAFTYYLNQQLGLMGANAYTTTQAIDMLKQCKAAYLLPCGIQGHLPCDSVVNYATRFKNIYQQKRDGSIYRDVKLTSAAYKIVDGANALVTAYQSKKATGTPVILPPYGLEPQSYDYIKSSTNRYLNKLNAICDRLITDVNSAAYGTYCISMPIDLNYTITSLDLNKLKLNNAYALAGDFASTPPVDELGKRVYAVNNCMNTTAFQLQWGGTSNSAVGFYFYRANAPLVRYIANDSTLNVSGNFNNELNSVYSYTFFEAPANLNTPADYNQFYNTSFSQIATGGYINAKDIVAISKPTIDGRFYDNISRNEYSSRLLKVKVTLKTGAVKDAYLVNDYDGSAFVKFKEVVDSNLYQDNCEAAFTYYLNQQLGLTGANAYTTTQAIDMLKQCKAINILPCGTSTTQEPSLCGRLEFPADSIKQPDPCLDSTHFAYVSATAMYNFYKDSLRGSFRDKYVAKCLEAKNIETFTLTSQTSQYHYTLYYYDQAGNLAKTVPPAGVKRDVSATWLNNVKTARANNQVLVPTHNLATTYRYNSLNQVVTQHSPDGGYSEFWYDRLGRLAVSRNAKQRKEGTYSFTEYDYLGRITLVGQKKQTTAMTDIISRNESSLRSWIRTPYNTTQFAEQVTRTVYDIEAPEVRATINGLTGALATDYPTVSKFKPKWYTLRNRVANTFYYDKLLFLSATNLNLDSIKYNTASFYSYDIHGNVDTLVQDYRVGDFVNFNRFKFMAYNYDLISGKVNQVHYQTGHRDQLYHRYDYDAENRIIDVYTTDNKYLVGTYDYEEHDAHYDYYDHGPLARSIIGNNQVQGVDYAYTLQGWLKGVNSTAANELQDIGKDGGVTNPYIARDAFGFNLNYYTGDYKPINNANGFNPFPGYSGVINPPTAHRDLWNGNITSMAVHIPTLNNTTNTGALLYSYKYDQLNRITAMNTYKGFNATNNSWTGITATNDYKEAVSYDPNGNILGYSRNGSVHNARPLAMDSLGYKYYYEKTTGGKGIYVPGKPLPADVKALTNQLAYVTDNVATANYTEDIDAQLINNYDYDSIGNLIKDNLEGITKIGWNVYGKIDTITKVNAGVTTTIIYTYDVAGNRISKSVKLSNSTNTNITWYVRDASGNVMAVYDITKGTTVTANNLIEHSLYGSSRLGLWQQQVNVNSTNAPVINLASTNKLTFTRGNKNYELSNHLGNVLVTVSDRKKAVMSTTNTNLVAYYQADLVTATDYYPFGMGMPGRTYSANSGYRYGFNGKEKDKSINSGALDFGARIYDGRIGRWFSVDPMAQERVSLSPYNFCSNNPISRVDPTGALDEWVEHDGKMEYDNRVTSQEDATALYGSGATYRANGYSYTSSTGNNIVLGDFGFFKNNGQIQSSPDMAANSTAYTNPAQAKLDAQASTSLVQASYPIAFGIRAAQAADVAIPEPTDALPWKWVGHGVLFLGTAYYVWKMEKEIEGILRRAGGPDGYMYSLNANVSGDYPVMTWGSAGATSTMPLLTGAVWKFGETSSSSDRYSQAELGRIGPGGVSEIPLMYGNQVQIKVAEKTAIYGYFMMNGHLPPGNKIFR
jgi:RHS repeat-associated protein